MKIQAAQFWKKSWPPIFLLASVIFIIRYFRHQAIHVATPANFAWQYLALGVALQLTYWLLNAFCWQSTILWYGKIKLGMLQSFTQLAMSTLGKYFPGKIWGMVARASALAQLGVSAQESLYATLNEQFLILYSAGLSSAVLWCAIDTTPLSILLLIGAVAVMPILVPIQKLGFRLAPRFLPLGKLNNAQAPMVLNLNKIMLLTTAYCIIWLLVGGIFCCVYCLFFQPPSSPLIFARLIVANTIGISIGFFAVFSPGGLGIREAITSSLLAAQLGVEQAILLCLLFRLWIVAFELISGLTLLIPHKTLSSKQFP